MTNGKTPGARSASAVILMYHRVRLEGAQPVEGDYALSTEQFTLHIRRLAESGRPVVPLDRVWSGLPPGRSVILTFDDGYDTDAEVALPVLKEFGLQAAFFVNPSLVGQPGHLDWPGVRRLFEGGMKIGSHGLDHTLLDGLALTELERQLGESRRVLEDQLGGVVDTLSLPGGSGGQRAVETAARLGYRAVLGSRPGRVVEPAAGRALPRFAVRRGHGPDRIAALANQSSRTIAAARLRYAAMQALVRVLGASTKDRVRDRLVSITRPPAGGDAG